MSRRELVDRLYAAFNARDVEAVARALAPDVDWPNAWEGGRVHGRDAVRDYWRRQFAAIDPAVTPTAIDERDDGTVRVTVHQVIRDLGGARIGEGTVIHVYRFEGDLVARMDVEA